MKTCTRCKEEKREDQFYKFKGVRDGLYSHCRACHLGYTSNWARLHPEQRNRHAREAYRRNPEKFKERSRQYQILNRGVIMDKGKRFAHQRWLRCIEGLGGKCECCGEICVTMLEIDHRNGFGNEHRRKMGGSVGVYCDIIARGFPKDEFAVMCASCNQSRRRNKGDCEHKSQPVAYGWCAS
jgi:hypothetical protein